MSLVRLNAKSRTELETRVLAAALKQSFEKGDSVGAQLAHQQLSVLLKQQKEEEQELSGQQAPPAPAPQTLDSDAIDAMSLAQLPDLEILDRAQSASPSPANEPSTGDLAQSEAMVSPPAEPEQPLNPALPAAEAATDPKATPAPAQAPSAESPSSEAGASLVAADVAPEISAAQDHGTADTHRAEPGPRAHETTTGDHAGYSQDLAQAGTRDGETKRASLDYQRPGEHSEFQIITSENTTIEGTDASQSMSGVILNKVDEAAPGLQYHAMYRMLQVSQMSSYDEIHKSFLRLVRRQLRELVGAKRPRKQELLGQLRQIWIAHDILTDPITRTDYDFRDLGLRGDSDALAPASSDGKTTRPPSRIGELLQVAGLLEEAELEIACDMHKAMPEVQFGTFLVKQGFIGERDLESVLIGQKLLRAGTISVAQFQVAMELSQSRGLPIRETLLERGYVSEQLLDEVVSATEKPSTVPPLAVAQLVDVAPTDAAAGLKAMPQNQNKPETETVDTSTVRTDAPSLQLSNAVPSWKDQLDWEAPETVVAKTSTPDAELDQKSASHANAAREAVSQTPSGPREINIANAAPSWKDQLDWGDAETQEVEEKRPDEGDFFSHMREAQSAFDIDSNPLPPHHENQAADKNTATGDHPSLANPDESQDEQTNESGAGKQGKSEQQEQS